MTKSLFEPRDFVPAHTPAESKALRTKAEGPLEGSQPEPKPEGIVLDRFRPFCINPEEGKHVVLDQRKPAPNGSYFTIPMFRIEAGRVVNPVDRTIAEKLSRLLNEQPELLRYCDG